MNNDVVRWLTPSPNQKSQRYNLNQNALQLSTKSLDNVNQNAYMSVSTAKSNVNKQRKFHRSGDNSLKIDFLKLILTIWLIINQQYVRLVLGDNSWTVNNINNDVSSTPSASSMVDDISNKNIDVITANLNDNNNHNIISDDDIEQMNHFTPTWAVSVPGGEDEANRVAEEHGFTNLGKVRRVFFIFDLL